MEKLKEEFFIGLNGEVNKKRSKELYNQLLIFQEKEPVLQNFYYKRALGSEYCGYKVFPHERWVTANILKELIFNNRDSFPGAIKTKDELYQTLEHDFIYRFKIKEDKFDEVLDYFKDYDCVKKFKEEEDKRVKEIMVTPVRKRSLGYIYGIFIEQEIVYVGMTCRKPEERFKEHKMCMYFSNIKNSQQKYLYQALREAKIAGKVIHYIVLREMEYNDRKQVEDAERETISGLRPRFNYAGVKVPYRYSDGTIYSEDGKNVVTGIAKSKIAEGLLEIEAKIKKLGNELIAGE